MARDSSAESGRLGNRLTERDARSLHGTAVARASNMARRIAAIVAMVVLIGLLLVLVWQVYLHHQHGVPTDEPAVVAYPARAV